MTTGKILHFADLGKERPIDRAICDLEHWREVLNNMSTLLPPRCIPMVLEWLRDWRVYLLERNDRRWPDGLYHVLDRDYMPWRKHQIALTFEQLRDAFPSGVLPRGWRQQDKILSVMSDDCFFKVRNRAYIQRCAAMVGAISRAIDTREAQTPKVPT